MSTFLKDVVVSILSGLAAGYILVSVVLHCLN